MLALRLPPEIERRLDQLAKATGRSKSFYARAAIVEYLGDLEDVYLAERRLEDLRAGGTETVSLEELIKQHGGEFERGAERDLGKLDSHVAQRILRFLRDRVAPLDDPRSIGEALRGGKLGSLWKYRVGDYRILASIEDKAVMILVVRIGNRADVYR